MRAFLLLFIFLAGCTPINQDALRVCETAIVGLNPSTKITLKSHEILSEAPYKIKINYNESEIICSFLPLIQANYPEIASITDQNIELSETKLILLKRFWLSQGLSEAEARQWIVTQKTIHGSKQTAYFLQVLVNALPICGLYMLLALAYALVYGLSGRVLLGFGDVAIVASYVGMALVFYAPIFAVIASICTMMLMQRSYISKLFFNNNGFSLIIASLAGSIVVLEVLRLIMGVAQYWNRPPLSYPVALFHSESFTTSFTINQLITIIISCLFTLFILRVFHRSKFSLQWKALAQDEKAAELFGVDKQTVLTKTLVISGLLAGVAGYLLTFHYGVAHYSYALLFGLKALAATIMGGIGSLGSAVLAAILIGLVESFWSGYAPIIWREAVVFVLLSLVICVRR